MESLGALEGRGRPFVIVLAVDVDGVERREERVEVKAWLLGVEREVGLIDLGRGCP